MRSDESDDGSSIHRSLGFSGPAGEYLNPTSYTLDDLAQFKNDHFRTADGLLVVVRFMLRIENILQSEFVNVMSVDLARELLSGFGMGEDSLSASAAPKTVSAPEQPQQPAAQQAENGSSGGTLSQEEIERLMGGAAPSGQQTPPQDTAESLRRQAQPGGDRAPDGRYGRTADTSSPKQSRIHLAENSARRKSSA